MPFFPCKMGFSHLNICIRGHWNETFSTTTNSLYLHTIAFHLYIIHWEYNPTRCHFLSLYAIANRFSGNKAHHTPFICRDNALTDWIVTRIITLLILCHGHMAWCIWNKIKIYICSCIKINHCCISQKVCVAELLILSYKSYFLPHICITVEYKIFQISEAFYVYLKCYWWQTIYALLITAANKIFQLLIMKLQYYAQCICNFLIF